MKKRLLALVLIAALCLPLLAACGGPSTTTPTRGQWDDHVFTSEYLGLRFVAPYGWEAATDAEIAEVMGIGAAFIAEAGAEIPDDLDTFHDMMVSSMFTGANVQIMFERHGGRRAPSADDFIDAMEDQLEEIGVGLTRISGTRRIGAYDWYSFATEMEIFGIVISGLQLFSIHEGYIRVIGVTYTEGFDSPEEILTNFVALGDAIPARQGEDFAGGIAALPGDIEGGEGEIGITTLPGDIATGGPISEVLLGTWAWDGDPNWTYVFAADGTATRGVPGQIETFTWWVEGDDHVLMDVGVMIESWTFIIEGDILTLDSRQVPGMTWSYVLV